MRKLLEKYPRGFEDSELPESEPQNRKDDGEHSEVTNVDREIMSSELVG